MEDLRPSGWWRWLLALILVAAVAGVAWYFIGQGRINLRLPNDPLSFLPALGPQATVTASPSSTRPPLFTITPPAAPPGAAAAGLAGSETPIVASEPITAVVTATPTSDLLTLPIPTNPPTATPRPTAAPTATPAPTTTISLTISITRRSWTKVTADGNVVAQDLLEAGQYVGLVSQSADHHPFR